jgi:hypothetical protein
VSDQTIPNITVAAELRPDFLLLVSTSAMEKKGKSLAILDTLKLRGLDYSSRHQKIEVIENSIIDLQSKVAQWMGDLAGEYDFTVNLTGGTKLMSIASYDFFTDFGSEMIYVPIPRNEYLTPFPKRRSRDPIPLGVRLTVDECLTAYGFSISNAKQLEKAREIAGSRSEATRFLFSRYQELRPLLKWMGDLMRPLKRTQLKKGYDFEGLFDVENEAQRQLLKSFSFRDDGGRVTRKIDEAERDYLRGGWLEERLFLAAREVLPPTSDVQLNVQCQDPQGNKNEFDILFALDNILHLVECKSLGAAEGTEEQVGGTINDFLYKLGALRQNFGLTPKAFLATTAETVLDKNGDLKTHLTERARQFGTRIIPLLEVPDPESYFVKELSLK